MVNFLKKHSWSPAAVGISLGILMVFSIVVLGRWLGASGAFVSLAAFFAHLIGWECSAAASGLCSTPSYFALDLGGAPFISFRVMVIFGVVLGAFISAYFSGAYSAQRIPTLWGARFGHSFLWRALIAFLGGFFIMIGAPLADGCTLSRGIFSGALLDPSAWIFMGALFASAVFVSFALYGVRRS